MLYEQEQKKYTCALVELTFNEKQGYNDTIDLLKNDRIYVYPMSAASWYTSDNTLFARQMK